MDRKLRSSSRARLAVSVSRVAWALAGLVLWISVLAPAQAQSDPEAPPALDEVPVSLIEALSPELGRFAVTTWVMQGPDQSAEFQFVVESGPALDGQGVRTVWQVAETSAFFGEITRSLDPDSGELVQLWYAATSGNWSQTRRTVDFLEAGYDESFSGEDSFGPFQARVRTRHGPGGYRWTIERRYEGTDWFVIDRGEAVRLEE